MEEAVEAAHATMTKELVLLKTQYATMQAEHSELTLRNEKVEKAEEDNAQLSARLLEVESLLEQKEEEYESTLNAKQAELLDTVEAKEAEYLETVNVQQTAYEATIKAKAEEFAEALETARVEFEAALEAKEEEHLSVLKAKEAEFEAALVQQKAEFYAILQAKEYALSVALVECDLKAKAEVVALPPLNLEVHDVDISKQPAKNEGPDGEYSPPKDPASCSFSFFGFNCVPAAM